MAAVLLASIQAGGTAGAGSSGFSGKVAETMDAGGYTYVLVDTGTNKLWAAAPKFSVKPGDAVLVPDSMPMKNFRSESLKRDFPVVYFTGGITVNGANPGAATLPAGHPDIGGLPVGHPPMAGKAAASPKVDFTGLKPAKGGKTVADVYAASASLGGKSVTIRGKVVKFNANIMGKNWLHLQDGTGSGDQKDLLVTTTGQAKLGDTVLVEGKVALNKDFGSGYKYNLLVEEAKVTVE